MVYTVDFNIGDDVNVVAQNNDFATVQDVTEKGYVLIDYNGKVMDGYFQDDDLMPDY